MSSAGMLGGAARGSIGRPCNPSGKSIFGHGSACSLVIDRESEKASKRSFVAGESPEAPSCRILGAQGSSMASRCGLSYESVASVSSSSGELPFSRFCKGAAAPAGSDGSRCSNSIPIPPLVSRSQSALVCRDWEGCRDRMLYPPSLAGKFSPYLRVHRSSGPPPSSGSSSGKERNGFSGEGQWRSTRAMASPDEREKALASPDFSDAGDMLLNKGTWNTNQYLSSPGSESEASWEQINMILRVVYAMAMYGGLAFAGSALCVFTGVDCSGGFKLSIETFVQGLGYAVPPMMALLFILEDEVVKVCPPARAIRDVEDEELIDFFVGMNPLQFVFVVAAGALSEELFFRVAIQGGLAHALQYTAKEVNDTVIGISSLTSTIPFFTPFAQVFAAVLTASLTGSMYFVISSPKDPKYVIAPVSGSKYSRNNRGDIKKRISAWYERRQLKKIYSPLMEALLALYLGFEWVQTGNIFGPMITHTLYSLVVVGNGLRRINDNRDKLRQRVSQVTQPKEEENSDVLNLDKL